jgi:hypothetical protein
LYDEGIPAHFMGRRDQAHQEREVTKKILPSIFANHFRNEKKTTTIMGGIKLISVNPIQARFRPEHQ